MLALVLVALLTLVALALDYVSLWGRLPLLDSDLWVFREGGRAFAQGGALYFVTVGNNDWLYPPFGAMVMVPLQWLPLDGLQTTWWILNIALLASVASIAFRPLLQRLDGAPRRAAALVGITVVSIALAPTADALGLGQVGIVLMWLCLVDVVLLEGRRSQGALVGVAAAIKLTPLVFIAYFLVVRRWRSALVSAGVLAACWAIAAAFRPDLWQQFVDERIALRTTSMIQGFDRTDFNQSLRGLLDGLGSSTPITLLWVTLSATVLAIALFAARREHRQGQLVAAAAIIGLAGVLVSPLSWHHHAVWVVPALGALIGDGLQRWRIYVAAAAALLMVVPPRTGGLIDLPADRFVIAYLVLMTGLVVSAWRTAGVVAVQPEQSHAA